MDYLQKTKMLSLLSEPLQQVTNQEMQSAYESFTEQLRTIVSQSEQNYSETFRMLNITRIELVGIESLHRHGQGEKRPKICLS